MDVESSGLSGGGRVHGERSRFRHIRGRRRFPTGFSYWYRRPAEGADRADFIGGWRGWQCRWHEMAELEADTFVPKHECMVKASGCRMNDPKNPGWVKAQFDDPSPAKRFKQGDY